MNPVADLSDKYQDAVKLFYEGNVKQAHELLTGLLEENSSDYDVHNFLGVIKLNEQKYNEAAVFFEKVISLCSYHREAYYNLGFCYQKLGDFDKAELNYNKRLEFDNNHFDSLNNLGIIYLNRKDYKLAESHLRFCLALKPDSAAVYNNLGNVNMELGKTAEGLSCYEVAVELEPRCAVFNFNLGIAYMGLKNYPEAIRFFEAAADIDPGYDDAYKNLAVIYSRLSEFSKSEEYLLKLKNDTFTKALLASNNGVKKLLNGLVNEALDLFEEALLYEPEHPEIHYNRGHALLLKGDFEQGWKEYDWRLKKDEFKEIKILKPLPDVIDLNGKRVLIKDEQGLGDSIQFVRFISLLKQRGAHTIFECSERLLPLFQHFKEIDELYSHQELDPEIVYDFDIPLLSLPRYFGTVPETIPVNIPYIKAEKEYSDKWKKIIPKSASFKIGISWAGNPNNTADKRRSCKLTDFNSLFETEGVEFYTLQKGTPVNQAKDFVYPLHVLDEYDNSFLDTTAIINQLDLVITVDTSIAHLAGAMGKETWVLLPFLPDWRWQLGRSDTPWYPNMKLFRQAEPDNWGTAFKQVKTALEAVKNKRSSENNMQKRNYNHIDNYFDEIERHIYPEPVSNLHDEITKGVVQKLTEIFQFPKNIKILDIGCGQGPALEAFRKYGFSPDGVTLGDEDVTICRQKGFDVLKMDQTFLSYRNNTFDLIWARHVLEHSVMPLFTLMEYRRVCRDGAVIYIEVPGAGTSAQHENNPNHYSVLTQKMWASLFSKAGLTLIESFTLPLTLQCGPDEYYGFICRCEKEKEAVKKSEAPEIYLALSKGENFGWGVCSKYIKQELSKKIVVTDLNEKKELVRKGRIPGKVFHALADLNFDPILNVYGDVNIGYTFFENELNKNSVFNSSRYDLVLAGSTWCKNKLKEKGIIHSDVLLQGIDPELFYPGGVKTNNNLFTIFSGGKFEYRKGQDLVLKAVKILQEKYDDIVLVNAWYNLWPQFLNTMLNSKHIKYEPKGNTWEEFMASLYAVNGIDSKRIITLPLIPNNNLREVYLKSDIGLFPNRCEGGTNLVLMEYMACGKPVVASFNSGHTDILTDSNSFMLTEQREDKLYSENNTLQADWLEPSVDEIIQKIETAYNNRDLVMKKGEQAGKDMLNFTWEKTADKLLKFLE